MTDTRARFVEAARRAFAERGFYGASIASIVAELPYTKQALLHHFGSKEKLYAEVLQQISSTLDQRMAEVAEHYAEPKQRIRQSFLAFYAYSIANPGDACLLMRELLDNTQRAEKAQNWYLKPFLQQLIELISQAKPDKYGHPQAALAAIYQVLGAINYFVISQTTLRSMYGEEQFAALGQQFVPQLEQLIKTSFELDTP